MFSLADHRFRLEGEPVWRDTDAATLHALLASGARCEAPLTGAVYGTLLNDRATLDAMGAELSAPPYKAPPRAPVLYVRPRNTWSGHGASVRVPAGDAGVVVGGSLGIVLGRVAVKVSVERALDYVAGYTTVVDLSVPHASVYRPVVDLRSRDGFCVIGPALVAGRHAGNPDAARIEIRVAGQRPFVAGTSTCVRSVARLLADVTEFMTLMPGDVLTMGVPFGAPLAHAGDAIEVRIDDHEPLRFSLRAEAAVMEGTP
ncbi:MAG TPA: fumarylacetoacetate hydrolase family protein [Rhodanobacteraceae bacterium]|nr:fumarylacetoacetate hydrolase family protein [Rhodanobacteraceae bacterium]